MGNLKVSIVTVSFNSLGTISDTVKSVLSQSYSNIEYIIVDGSSTDGTVELIKSYGSRISKFISEPDKGIYDAINKGIKLATGDIIGILNADDFFYDNDVISKVVQAFQAEEIDAINKGILLSTGDIVGILNSDDFFYDSDVIKTVASAFQKNHIDAVYGDVEFFDSMKPSKIVRYYSSKYFNPNKFKFGFMPAHPTFYVKRKLFEKLGYYKTDYEIAADYELLLRFFLIHQISYKYLEMPFVSMRTGGVSNKSILSNFTLNREIARACKENGIKTNYLNIYSKYFVKIFEFFGNRSIRRSNIPPDPHQEGNFIIDLIF